MPENITLITEKKLSLKEIKEIKELRERERIAIIKRCRELWADDVVDWLFRNE